MYKYKYTFNNIISNDLLLKLNYKNILEIKKLNKINLNIGIANQVILNKKKIILCLLALELISSQKGIVTRAKKAINTFNLQKNLAIGCQVTLRKNNMYNFIYKLINIILPKNQKFKNFNIKKFDNNSNYSLGLKEILIFSEIEYEIFQFIKFGLNITFNNKINNKIETKLIFTGFQLPF